MNPQTGVETTKHKERHEIQTGVQRTPCWNLAPAFGVRCLQHRSRKQEYIEISHHAGIALPRRAKAAINRRTPNAFAVVNAFETALQVPKRPIMECKRQGNLKRCNCSYSGCPRHGICCECLQYHLGMRELPACCFPDEVERTYDRSFERFAQLVQARAV